jgi:hypothetical protein
MKKSILITTLVFGALFLSTSILVRTAFSSGATAQSSGSWHKFKKATEEKMDRLDKKMNALEKKIKAGNEKAKAEFKETLEESRKIKKLIASKLDKVGDQSRASWQEAKEDIDAGLKKLEDSYERLKADLER